MKKTSKVSRDSKREPADKGSKKSSAPKLDYEMLDRIVERAFFHALSMIEIANHQRPDQGRGEPKVGGHPAACASSKHILGAIHLVLRQPEDYFACKPHVSPIDHAFNYLLHNFRNPNGELMNVDERKAVMRNLRHFSKDEPVFQSYHAESDPDGYRYFPSGSVGIPPVNALYTSLGYDFIKHHGFELSEDPTFWCLMGDSEFREGSLMEAMPDAGERNLSNLVWIVDFNRQNLDGTRTFNEEAFQGSDADRIVRIAEANGWHGVKLKHGKYREQLFALPGGDEFKRVLDEEFTDFEFQALLASHNTHLIREVLAKKSPKLKGWLKQFSDDELKKAYFNLAGHDLESLVEAFTEAKHARQENRGRPTLIVAYTIKGHGLECAAMSGNHSALPEEAELKKMAETLGTTLDPAFAPFADGSEEEAYLETRREALTSGIQQVIDQTKQRQDEWLARAEREIEWPKDFDIQALKFNPVAHTQWMWGQVAAKLDRLARGEAKETSADKGDWGKVARYFVTMAPDVGSSTNTSPNMNGKLYGDIGQEDFEKEYGAKDEKAPDVIPNTGSRTGDLRFEIAEGNCMSAAGSLGKFFHFTGIPLFPAMTIYDFFIKRAHDQFYYNLYWHSSFATVGTPSGVTLAPEGAQHSWKSDFQIPNCVTWEPAFARELEWIMADMLRRHFMRDNHDREAVLLRLVTKGLVQKDWLERLKVQPRFQGVAEAEMLETVRQDVLRGGYTIIDYRKDPDYVPGDNVVHIFAMGALVAEAIKASDNLRQKGILANVHIVTSSDLLLGNFAEHDNYAHLRERLGINGDLYLRQETERHIESQATWYGLQGARIPIVSVHDGEPGLLDNIGSIVGVKQRTLAIRKTSKSGTTVDIFHYHHIDAEGIEQATEAVLKETAEERFVVLPQIVENFRESGS